MTDSVLFLPKTDYACFQDAGIICTWNPGEYATTVLNACYSVVLWRNEPKIVVHLKSVQAHQKQSCRSTAAGQQGTAMHNS